MFRCTAESFQMSALEKALHFLKRHPDQAETLNRFYLAHQSYLWFLS